LATGSTPIHLPENETNGDPVYFAHDVLDETIEVGKKVFVVGGGSVGSGTADFLAERGHEVTLLLRRTDIGSKLEPSTKKSIQKRLEKNRVRIISRAYFKGFGKGKVKIDHEGIEKYFDGDQVIIAIGAKPENSLFQEIKGKMEHVYAIGDCVEPRGIQEAISEGAMIGRIV
jgi:pyruvate/2-oxoglutarate dehydrogenase complex dihydrolipoamide dehydrogenase (E3) component